MTAHDWETLRGLSLARQFPELDGRDATTVVEAVRRIGPIQSQTARSPYVGLGARVPGLRHADVTAAYEQHGIVRGSTIRGTVHTSTADHHALLDATTRVGQRPHWLRQLRIEDSEVEQLWQVLEEYAADTWRTPAELHERLCTFLAERGEELPPAVDQGLGRYLSFGHGGLLRRPLKGPWSGQGAPGYRTATAVLPHRHLPDDPLAAAVRVHIASYGPASRRDISWWSGLGLRRVDELLDRLDLDWVDGPDGTPYADVAGAPPPLDLPGVRLLPEFDALLCGYDPKARDRFVAPVDHQQLWNKSNGFMRAPLLVDGRIGGHWRLEGTTARPELGVVVFDGTRRPRVRELEGPASALASVLDLTVPAVRITRG